MRMYKICCKCPRHTLFNGITAFRDKQNGDIEWACSAADRTYYTWVTTVNKFNEPDDCDFALEHLLESKGCAARY